MPLRVHTVDESKNIDDIPEHLRYISAEQVYALQTTIQSTLVRIVYSTVIRKLQV